MNPNDAHAIDMPFFASNRSPVLHAHSVTVPGVCAGWCHLLERHGRLRPSEVLEPAIALAEDGFPVAPITSALWSASAGQLQACPGAKALLIEGRGPRPGDTSATPASTRGPRSTPRASACPPEPRRAASSSRPTFQRQRSAHSRRAGTHSRASADSPAFNSNAAKRSGATPTEHCGEAATRAPMAAQCHSEFRRGSCPATSQNTS
jgi:gamma-glutamyltranspeptidase/glutathione hydrolase